MRASHRGRWSASRYRFGGLVVGQSAAIQFMLPAILGRLAARFRIGWRTRLNA